MKSEATELQPIGKKAVLVVDEELIQSALGQIRETLSIGMARAAQDLGRYLLDTFFAGDAVNYRSRTYGNPSFDALCARKDALASLGLSRSTLYNCLRIHLQVLEAGVDELAELPYTHQVALLAAPQETKGDLARRALKEALTVQQLRDQVKAERPSGISKRGRPPKPVVAKALDRVYRAMDELEDTWEADLDATRGSIDLGDVLKRARESKQRLEDLLTRLEKLG